jgi:1-acyl-sn-glycerol-3-phosphate acyltransferase
MGHFIYLIVKFYTTLSLSFYFNKLDVHGRENLKSNGPFLFAANHQNAFMDGLLVVTTNSVPVHFLIRADIFKTTFARAILKWMKLLPVYRIRDGFSSLSKNQEQFDECVRLFSKKESVLIFPEGNHGNTRRLRPLSKGFTRIAFEAQRQRPDLNLQVVPVSINYSHYKAFNSRVSIYYGKPIPVSDFYREPIPQQANAFKDLVDEEIKKHLTHIDDEARYDEILKKLEATNPDFANPDDTNERIRKIIRGENVPRTENKISWFYLLTTPLRPVAWLINFIPELGWRKFIKGVKDPVFNMSMKFGFGWIPLQLYYLILTGIASIWLGWWALALYPILLSTLKILRRPV